MAGWTRLCTVVVCVAIGMLAALPVSDAQSVNLYELARFDLSATSGTAGGVFIGSNPSAVGWNGSKLYVAGFNGSGATATTSIVEITNAAGVATGAVSGFVTPTYSAPFGGISMPNSRGYTGLAMKDSTLLATLDTGSNSPSGLQAFNAAAGNSKLWDLSNSGTTTANVGTARVGGGPGFDPGFAGGGSGAAWTISGQGRRFLNNATTGAAIYTPTANVPPGAAQAMILNGGVTGWRDIDFNPANGDVYTRNNNMLQLNVRTGSNTCLSTGTLGNLTSASGVIGQNLGFMDGVADPQGFNGDLIVLNDRPNANSGQVATNVIKFFTTGTGASPVSALWNFLSTPLTSTGFYDFEWDSGTKTLAVMDFTNRAVSIFSTTAPVPEIDPGGMPTAVAVLAGFAALHERLAGRSKRRRGGVGEDLQPGRGGDSGA